MVLRVRKLRRRAALAILCFVLAGVVSVRAQEEPRLPDPDRVLSAGPWLLAPSLTAGWSNDSNVFYQSAGANPTKDSILHIVPELRALLPFRNSEFEGRYRRDFVDYKDTSLDNSGYAEYSSALRLRFSSHDMLEFTGTLTRGWAETLQFDVGELTFHGEPYRHNTWGVGLSREVLGRRGYSLRIQRMDLNFDADADVRFFDFRANSLEAEYREPVRENLWILTTIRLENADHFCRNFDPSGALCPEVGVPFRTEEAGMVLFGVRGAVRGQDPFLFRIGQDTRRYTSPLRAGSRVDDDLVGDGYLTLRVGPSSRLHFNWNRGLWSSFYLDNDFYRSQGLETTFEKLGVRGTSWGAKVGLQAVDYARGLELEARRRDRRVFGQVYATLQLRQRTALRLSVERHRRSSNLEGFDYDGTVFFAGMVLGWF